MNKLYYLLLLLLTSCTDPHIIGKTQDKTIDPNAGVHDGPATTGGSAILWFIMSIIAFVILAATIKPFIPLIFNKNAKTNDDSAATNTDNS